MDARIVEGPGCPDHAVLNVVEAVGSRRVGDVREGQRRFPLVVRLPTDPGMERTIPMEVVIRSPDGELRVPITFKSGEALDSVSPSRN